MLIHMQSFKRNVLWKEKALMIKKDEIVLRNKALRDASQISLRLNHRLLSVWCLAFKIT